VRATQGWLASRKGVAAKAALEQCDSVDPVEAAVAAARRLGVQVGAPAVLRATNNTVVWLRPSPVVAKVGEHARLERELAAARFLVDHGAPVVGPSKAIPPVVHVEDVFSMSFWEYAPQHAGTEPGSRPVAIALHELHQTLRGLPTSGGPRLTSFSWELHHAHRCLGSPEFAPELGHADRHVLRRAIERLLPGLERRADRVVILHGAPHRLNILLVAGKPRFIDFETICRGPIEWDLAHLEDDVAAAYPQRFDADSLRIARLLASAKTAAWCWAAEPNNKEMRWHADHHLKAVRDAEI
jgi:hypothetical protein